jgi:hypothetical protein
MPVNEIHPYNFPPSQANDFERKGHPGKFLKSITCGSGTTYFTGSNYGVGGIVIPEGAQGTMYFSAGGSLPIDELADSKRVLEFSLSSVTVTTGTVYALIKNQISK